MQRIPERFAEVADAILWPLVLFWVGAIIALGQLAMSHEPWSWRLAIGRAVTNGALSMGAGVILIPHPEASMIAIVGLAGVLGSLGTTGVERWIARWFDRREVQK